jgi:5'-nucleotidase / UDP-sugar diphosphatase
VKARRLLVLALLWAACRAPVRAPAPLPAGSLLLAHTNDLHAHFLPEPAPWLPGEPRIGGMVALSAELEALRAAAGEEAVLYLDGGDLLTGTPLMEFRAMDARGGDMVDFLELLGCDAWVMGNHEFDFGYENAAAIARASERVGVPVLSANLDERLGGPPAFPALRDHVILERNGVRIGVFGLTTPGLERLASRDTMARLAVAPLVAEARAQVAALDPDTDLIVALTHIGIESDRRLAADVEGIDLIVGGHSHTAMLSPERVGATWIVQAGSYGRQLGVARLDVVDDAIARFEARLVDLGPAPPRGTPRREVVRLADTLEDRVEERFGAVLGEVAADLRREGGQESGLGRWAADAMRAAGRAEIGLYNSGGLRADLLAGPLTRRDLYEVFPFANQVVRFELTGEELVVLVLHSAAGMVGGRHAPMQMSGLQATWHAPRGAPEIVDLQVGGRPVELGRRYVLATNSFVAEQWRSNLGVEPRDPVVLDVTALQAAEAWAAQGPLRPPPDARLVRIAP